MEDLNGVRLFVRVAEAQSFTAAGRRLGITSSAVSKAISRLERGLGVRLLDRTTRSVALTNDGRDFYERCRQMLADLDEAEMHLTQSVSTPRGRLRLYMPSGFGRKLIIPRLAETMKHHPQLRIDIELGNRMLDPREEGPDAVIRFGHFTDKGLVSRHLCDVHFVACASPAYLERNGVPSSPDELERHVCLGYASPRTGDYRDWVFLKDGKPFARSMSANLNINDGESLLNMAVAGVGIAMISTFIAHDAVRKGALRIVLRDYIAPPTPVAALCPQGRQHAPRIRWLLDLLQQLIPSPPPWEEIVSSGAPDSRDGLTRIAR